MATAGVGLDILEIARMERALARTPRLETRVFTEAERAYCNKRARPAQHFAGRFAAREAVLKALGTGFSQGIGFQDVSIAHDEAGRPVAVLAGKAAELAADKGVLEVVLSLSYTHDIAACTAVAVTQDVRPHKQEVADAQAEMFQSFKEARSILDELDTALAEQVHTEPVQLVAPDALVTSAADDARAVSAAYDALTAPAVLAADDMTKPPVVLATGDTPAPLTTQTEGDGLNAARS